MLHHLRFRAGRAALAATFGIGVGLAGAAATGEQISVTHYGVLMYGTPYAVALDKGFFKESGIDITGILTSTGGGTTVRNVMAGGLPYGEVALSAALAAAREGIDIKIVNSGVQTVADILWVTMPGSEVKTVKDLIGKKMAITSPRSVTDSLSMMVLDKAGVPLDKVERPALGGLGSGLTALEKGAVQAAAIIDPLWAARKDKYQVLFYVKDVLPAMTQAVGITTTAFAKSSPDKLRAIISGRRKGVDFIYANPKETAAILSRTYEKLPVEVAETAVNNMVAFKYWSRGDFDLKGMNEFVRGLQMVGEVQGPIDWDKIIDRSFLPADLKGSS